VIGRTASIFDTAEVRLSLLLIIATRAQPSVGLSVAKPPAIPKACLVVLLSFFPSLAARNHRAKLRVVTVVTTSLIADPSGLPSLTSRCRSPGVSVDRRKIPLLLESAGDVDDVFRPLITEIGPPRNLAWHLRANAFGLLADLEAMVSMDASSEIVDA